MKKGQADAIGILVIIVLLFLVLTFVFAIYINSQEDNGERRLQNVANNFANTWIGVTLCDGVDVGEALENCAIGDTIQVCGDSACELAKQSALSIQSSVDPRYGYTLQVLDNEFPIIDEKSSGKCLEKISSDKVIVNQDLYVKYSLCL